jgi:hypothetical protein
MRYRQARIKKQANSSIPAEFVVNCRYDEVIKMAGRQPKLTRRDRYFYGYSLLKKEKTLQSLMTLWPLAKMDCPELQNDCTTIASHLLQDEAFLSALSTEVFPEETLSSLFSIARELLPDTPNYHIFVQRILHRFWQEKRYDKLENLLKSYSNNQIELFVENMGKLAFLQARKKIGSGIPAFVSLILTGGGCLLRREKIYHCDIQEAIFLLASEIKFILKKFYDEGRLNTSWSIDTLNSYIDTESGILAQVLQLAINTGTQFSIIPAPGYLLHFDPAMQKVGQDFLPWLKGNHSVLHEAYKSGTRDTPETLKLAERNILPTASLFLQEDPLALLGVSFADSKHEIMQKVMRLIRETPDKMSVYRKALDEMFKPARRFLHQYFRSMAWCDKNLSAGKTSSSSFQSGTSLEKIPFRKTLYHDASHA